MATYEFQLAYTITPYHCENKAAQARKIIKGIDDWEVVGDIETILVGEISFYCDGSNEDKRRKCKDVIKGKIKYTFREHDVYDYTKSYFSLMVSGLGKHITFTI